MNLPQNGRVVVIDDKLEDEAKPLIEALSKNGIATRFFTGRASALPEKPLDGVRLIFLDMVLEGMDFTTDTGDIVKALIAVLGRIVTSKNGPYIIFGWTNSPQHLQDLVSALPVKRVLYVDMEKSDCFSDPAKVLQKIEQKLEQKLNEIGSLQVLFRWENLVNDSAYLTVNDFYGLCVNEAKPVEALDSLLLRLAKANLGKLYKEKKPEELIVNSLFCLNGPFLDNVETTLQAVDFRNIWARAPEYPKGDKDFEIDAKINTRIHVAQCSDSTVVPGNVYESWDASASKTLSEMVRDCLDPEPIRLAYLDAKRAAGVETSKDGQLIEEHKKAIFKEISAQTEEIIRNSKCCLVEVSPICDHAQKKWRRHRLLPCIVWQTSYVDCLKKNADFLFVTPRIYNTSCSPATFHFVFDFRHFHACSFDEAKNRKPLFRLRKDLIIEIQSRLTRHVSRPGILSL